VSQILASLDDINANLVSDAPHVVRATDENTHLLQISVARVVRAYLSRLIPSATLIVWDLSSDPPVIPPDVVREIAGKMIAAQLYFNETSKTSITIEDRSFAQKRYDEAMALLNGIISGDIVIEGIVTEEMTDLDFFPVDDTDRAFTMSMEL
jgi:hypothetical protein